MRLGVVMAAAFVVVATAAVLYHQAVVAEVEKRARQAIDDEVRNMPQKLPDIVAGWAEQFMKGVEDFLTPGRGGNEERKG